MGTGSRTSLPMVLADEMGADWARVKIIQAEGDEPKYGNQDTDGSRSMRHHIQSMRQMGASVRHMLVQAAAKKWGVDAKSVEVGVHEGSSGGEKAGFGELAADAMDLGRSVVGGPYLQVGSRVPLHRQGQCAHHRPA